MTSGSPRILLSYTEPQVSVLLRALALLPWHEANELIISTRDQLNRRAEALQEEALKQRLADEQQRTKGKEATKRLQKADNPAPNGEDKRA